MYRGLATAVLLGIIALIIMPECAFAGQVGKGLGGDVINAHADSLSEFLFGPVSRVAAVFGGAIGMIRGYLQASGMQMFTFGGLLISGMVLPQFINSIYSLILP